MLSKSVIAVIALALAAPAFAQEDAVVVTATRFPEKQLEHPVGVTVITREQIADSAAASLPDLLSRYAGINTRNSSGSPDVSIDMRGFGMSGDQNTLVLLDGQRLNDIELTTVSWSAIPLDAIERVEIQRGGGAVLYGAGATGGTINIITRSPLAGRKSAALSTSYGSYNTNELRGTVNVAGTDTGLSLTANQYDSDNYRANNRLEQGNLLGDLRWTGDRAGLVFKFGVDNQNLRLPGVRTAAQLGTDPRGSATPNDYSARDGRQATLSGRYAFDSAEFAVDLSYRDTKRIGFFDDYSGFGFSTFTDTRSQGVGTHAAPEEALSVPGTRQRSCSRHGRRHLGLPRTARCPLRATRRAASRSGSHAEGPSLLRAEPHGAWRQHQAHAGCAPAAGGNQRQ